MVQKSFSSILFVLLLTVLLVAEAVSSTGTATIRGTVTDTETGKPLPLVNITIEGTSRGAGADSMGRFVIVNVPPGRYKIVASSIGYRTIIKEIVIVPAQTVTVDFKLQESPLELKGVVITGTRTPRYIKEVPVYTEVITRKAIEDRSAHNLYEALDGAPGIRVEQQCQACNFSVLRMQGLGADHTQILLDGQPAYSGLAAVYGLQQLSTAEIDRIEVVKGAGSALYGSNAIAGAVNIISLKPQRTECSIGIELGEYGTNKYEITSATKKDNIGLFLFAQQNRNNAVDVSGDGSSSSEVREADGVADRVKTDGKSGGFNLFVDDVFSGTDRLTIRGRLLGEFRQGGTISDNRYENPFTEGTEQIITDRYSAEIGYLKPFATGSEIHFNSSVTRHKRNATNDTFLGDYADANGEPPPAELLRPYIAEDNLYVATVNYIHPFSHSHRLLGGIQYTRNELDESGKYVVVDKDNPDYGTPYTSYSKKKADEFGAYIQDEYTITADVELVAGLRFDHHNSEDNFRGSGDIAPGGVEPVEYQESTVNPRFAVKYSVTPALILRGSVGTGFRVPYGFSEDLHLCSGSPRVWKGSNLEPERSASYSVTADYTASGLGLNINLYRTELKDAIAFTDAGDEAGALGYTYEWKNIDDAYVMGVEVNAQLALTKDLALALNLALNKGEYDNAREDWIGTPYEAVSRKVSRYPETAGGFKVEYSPLDWTLVADGDVRGKMYIDYFRDEEEPTMIKETESYVILNVQASKRLIEWFRLYLGVKNLTDYIQEERHIDDAAFMYAPMYGRMIYGGMQLSLR